MHVSGAYNIPGANRSDAAVDVWRAVTQFASFGFCKAHAAAFAVPTYQSAWLKAHYPAHLYAGLLTHDPGMYPRRAILDDARRHGIPILPLDVNSSEPEYVVEPVPGGQGDGAGSFGIRIGFQDVHGISDAEIRSILTARADRPFRDVGDLMRRTTVSRPVIEALAHAGGFDALEPTRRRHLFTAMTAEPQREGDQLTLAMGADPAEGHRFKDYSDAEVVRAELEVLGLDATRHIVSFYEPLLAENAISQQVYDNAVAAAKEAEAQVRASRAAIAEAKLGVEYAEIRAPLTGRIGASQVFEGALITAGQTLLATISADDPAWVDFSLSESELLDYMHRYGPTEPTPDSALPALRSSFFVSVTSRMMQTTIAMPATIATMIGHLGFFASTGPDEAPVSSVASV